MTAYGTIRDAVSAMKAGAYDDLEKPVDADHLLALVRRALDHRSLLHENALLKERFSQELDVPEILGESAALKNALDQVRRVAATDATVLLLGESGTGKELFARAVHHLSGRKTHSFFPINCAAIPDNLLESELFGYERGAFTGATGTKRGKFEIADKGTLFLDEIGDLSLGLQGKVLRVIEQRQFERVEGPRPAASISAWSPRPTRTSRGWRPRARSARTSTFDCLCSPSPCRRCASAWKTCRSSPGTSSRSSPPSRRSAGPSSCRPKRSPPSRPTPGPGTCASSRTPSSAPSFWEREAFSSRSTCSCPRGPGPPEQVLKPAGATVFRLVTTQDARGIRARHAAVDVALSQRAL